jgi:hypothetical protein
MDPKTQTYLLHTMKLLEHSAPLAYSYAAQLHRIDCIQQILIGLLALVMGLLGVHWLRAIKQITDDLMMITMMMLKIFMTVIGLIAAATILLNIWNWVGIFDPQMGLAHTLYAAALAHL